MKNKIKNFLKYNKLIYALYYYIVSFLINILKVFIRTDEKLILFNSFAGRKYDDSPKEIFTMMRKDNRFKDYKLVWAFDDPKSHIINCAETIKTDTFSYFIKSLKAKVWITNSSSERGLNFKGKQTIYLNTWHGTPLKKMGTDLIKSNNSFKSRSKNKVDFMNCQSEYEREIFSRVFNIPKSNFLPFGLPRNDILINYSENYRRNIRENLKIPADKKVILYAPTFREYSRDKNDITLNIPIDINKWEKNLSKDYILLFRAHYEVSKHMKIEDNSFVRDMTNYESLNNLMIASDILISDYSSIFFDYSLMNKPMIHFTYDYDTYLSNRGLYFDIRKYLSGSYSAEQVMELIMCLDYEEEIKKTIKFKDEFLNYYGESTKQTLDYLYSKLISN